MNDYYDLQMGLPEEPIEEPEVPEIPDPLREDPVYDPPEPLPVTEPIPRFDPDTEPLPRPERIPPFPEPGPEPGSPYILSI